MSSSSFLGVGLLFFLSLLLFLLLESFLLLTLFRFLFDLLRRLLPLAFEEEVNNSAFEDRVAEYAASTSQCTSWERRFTLVHGVKLECLALFALLIDGSYMSSALQYRDSEVALFIIAFDAPALLWVVLNTELTGKAADAEVDHVVVV